MPHTLLPPHNAVEFLPVVCPPASLPLVEDDELVALLERAAESELDGLVRVLTKKGGLTCQLSGLQTFQENFPRHRLYARDVAAEIQKYGANTLATQIFRAGKGVAYEEIVRDVASKLGLPNGGKVPIIEASIRNLFLKESWRSMNRKERQAFLEELQVRDLTLVANTALPAAALEAVKVSGFGAYKLTVIVANAMARTVLGHGLSFLTNAALTKSLSVLAGPVGWSFAGLLAAHSISGEAYRVTVPCVIQISMIRAAVSERESIKKRRWALRVIAIMALLSLAILLTFTLIRFLS